MVTDLVHILDVEGNKIGEKPKGDIDKVRDIVEAVYVKIFIGEKLLLAKIVQKQGGLKKMNEGKWGAPIATIVRVGESAEDAFKRASLDDVGQVPGIFKTYPRMMLEFSNGSKRHVYKFEARLKNIPKHEDKEFVILSSEELKKLVAIGEVAETYMKLI